MNNLSPLKTKTNQKKKKEKLKFTTCPFWSPRPDLKSWETMWTGVLSFLLQSYDLFPESCDKNMEDMEWGLCQPLTVDW